MNNFYKKLLPIVLALMISLFAFAGCGGDATNLKGSATVVIAGTDSKVYTVDLADAKMTSASTGWDLIIYLADNENLQFAAESSAYGKYFTKIGELEENKDDKKFISIYTSVEKDFGTWEPIATVNYGGKTLTASGVGISSMHVEENCTLYFTIIYY